MTPWIFVGILLVLFGPLAWGVYDGKTKREVVLWRSFTVIWGLLWALFNVTNGAHPSIVLRVLGGFAFGMLALAFLNCAYFILQALFRTVVALLHKVDRHLFYSN